jgi:hypothetical protein
MRAFSFRPLGLVLIASAIGLSAPDAGADVWGYIDEQGRPHVATERLDERYQLFFKGRSSADVPVAPVESATDALFERTAIFRRMEGHPNVKRFEPLIARYAKQANVDAALVKAMIAVESAYQPDAVSAKGALGLMQVIPETGERYGISGDKKRTATQKLLDPAINVQVGTRYLRDLLAMFSNDLSLALAAYNAGEGAVLRYANQVPPYPETQEYVKLVQQFYALYRPPPPPLPPGKPMRITIPPRGGEPR